jgi:lipoprotein NlpD
MKKILCILPFLLLAGCVTRPPAPVSDSASTRVESARSSKAAADKGQAAKKPVAPLEGVEVRSISGSAPVVSRSLEERPLPPPPSAPAPVADKPAPAPVAPPAPAVAPVPVEIDWAWPANGKLLAGFSEAGSAQEANKGLDIAGRIGDPVLAAAAGKVIYVGAFAKHGNLVVILHANGYSSVYAHNSKILVKEGQAVTRGQKIAELGDSDAEQPKLHFELRQNGKPIDPQKFLPAR